jgi:hypothetical protein
LLIDDGRIGRSDEFFLKSGEGVVGCRSVARKIACKASGDALAPHDASWQDSKLDSMTVRIRHHSWLPLLSESLFADVRIAGDALPGRNKLIDVRIDREQQEIGVLSLIGKTTVVLVKLPAEDDVLMAFLAQRFGATLN